MQKVVAQQAQWDKDERDAVNRIVKSAPGEALDSDESDDNIDFGGADTAKSILDKATGLANDLANSDSEDEEPRSGIMGMKFMREAARREREQRRKSAKDLSAEIDTLRMSVKGKSPDAEMDDTSESDDDTASDSDSDSSSGDLSDEEETDARGASDRKRSLKQMADAGSRGMTVKKRKLPVIPDRLLEAAAASDVMSQGHGTRTTPTTTTAQDLSVETSHDPHVTPPPPTETVSTTDALADLLTSHETTALLDRVAEQEDLIKEAFVTSDTPNTDTATLVEEDEKEQRPPKPGFLPGWGSWAGSKTYMSQQRRKPSEESPTTTPASDLPKVYINRRLDRKLAPYFVNSLPHPYSSKDQFEMTQAHPLGPEWNTVQVHDRFVQPKVHVRPGTVIMPLEYAKHVPEEQLDSLLDAWKHKAKTRAPKTRL